MHVAPNTTVPKGNSSSSSDSLAKTDKAFADLFASDNETPEQILKQVASSSTSMMAWKIKEMKKHIAHQVMTEHNLTQETVSQLPATQRADVENLVLKEVSERLKMAMANMTDDSKPKPSANLTGKLSGPVLQKTIEMGQEVA